MKAEKGVFKPGRAAPRIDAAAKVRGLERYAADYYSDDFLWAGVRRAGIPHGRLHAIHTAEAEQIPGVVAILTHKDVPGENRIGLIRKDQPVLADTKICHSGDPVALVLAGNRAALKQALSAITFDYTPLPAVFDVEESLSEDAPLIHDESPEGNAHRVVSVEVGDPVQALKKSDVTVEAVFEVPAQEHAYLETEAGWAYEDETGRLVIVASTQTPFRDCLEIAPVLAMDAEKIRVIAPYLGGAFGGKDGITVQCFLGLAALRSKGRPVKMWWDREESFLAGVKRLSARMHYRLGATFNGELTALECRLYFNGGAYANLGGEIMTLGAEHAGSAYRIPDVSIKGWCVYTNGSVGGPFRGFGVPQATAAMEQMIDLLALKLSMDPLAIRLKNAVQKGDRNCLGVTLTNSTGIMDCLRTLSEHPLWKKKDSWKEAAGTFKVRGVGMACMAHAMGYPPIVPDQATAKIELTAEGKICVYAGVADMGQGNAGTCGHIASALLNQDPSTMELVLPDTARTLPSGSSSASRTTYTYGNALIEATRILKERIFKKAATTVVGSTVDEFELLPGRVRHGPTGKEVPLAEVAGLFHDDERISTAYFRMPTACEKLDVIYMGPHLIFSYGAHLVYVEIDRLTGAVDVKACLAVTDGGRVLNPQVYEQQIQGGIAQGIGYALSEDFRTSRGNVVTGNFSTYIIPTSMDVPEMISIPVEIDEETGPFGLKGVGEISISGTLPAIANAIADGCGQRIMSAPMTGEKVLRLLERSPHKGDYRI
jgi:CO/xanthine dehydrogenase Mo-binding subunit